MENIIAFLTHEAWAQNMNAHPGFYLSSFEAEQSSKVLDFRFLLSCSAISY